MTSVHAPKLVDTLREITGKRTFLTTTSATAMLAASAVLGLHHSAYAQATQTAQANLEEIVVTGSRIAVNGNNAPTPVTVVSTAELQATTPGTVTDGLLKLPIFATANGAQGTSSSTTSSVLNLRNFGAERTLVLQDGRRVAPTSTSNTVQTVVIPQMFVSRVDVVTGGAGAVYGSDAVTGVVNYILDNKFNGVKVDTQGGISNYGDAESYKFGIAAGTDFGGGRLHVQASYQYSKEAGIPDKTARPIGALLNCRGGTGSAALPFHLVQDCRSNTITFGGMINVGPGSNYQFADGGKLIRLTTGTPIPGVTNATQGGDGGWEPGLPLRGRTEYQQVFARADYDVTDSVHSFVQVTYHESEDYQTGLFIGGSSNLTFSTTNAFLPADTQAFLSQGGATTFRMTKTWLDTQSLDSKRDILNRSAVIGFDGDIGDSWAWDASFTHGQAAVKSWAIGQFNNDKWAAALDAVPNPAVGGVAGVAVGAPVCQVLLTEFASRFTGCIPMNAFGPNANLAAAGGPGYLKYASRYAQSDTWNTYKNTMDDFAVSFSGDVFDLPAGPIKAAISGEYRVMKLTNDTDTLSTAPQDCRGLRFNCYERATNGVGGTLWFIGATVPLSAKEKIGEGAIEATVPVFADQPFAKSLNVNGAFRYADYSVSGGATTWKVGFDWRPTDELLIRGTRSRDVRAPALYELNAPISFSLGNITDVHTGNTNVGGVQTVIRGNQTLVPEEGVSTTIGVVYQPGFLPNLALTVDYWNFNLNNAIQNVGANPTTNQLCEDSNGTSPLCDLFVRPFPFSNRTPANVPTQLVSTYLNVAEDWARGVDFEANYNFHLEDITSALAGHITLRGMVSYQPVAQSQFQPTQPIINAAGFATSTPSGVPKWKFAGFASYNLENFTLSAQQRWRSSMRENPNAALFYTPNKIKSIGYTDATIRYDFSVSGVNSSLVFTVNNVFNTNPPVVISRASNSSLANFNTPFFPSDDVMGRYFTLGFKARM